MRALAGVVAALMMIVGGSLLLYVAADGGWMTLWGVALILPSVYAARNGWYER